MHVCISASVKLLMVTVVNSEVIKPDVLEEIILSSAIRHLSLGDVVQNLAFHEQNATCEYRLLIEVMSELYKRLYAMLRQLQVKLTTFVAF